MPRPHNTDPYTIYGTAQAPWRDPEGETLNDPARRRKASERDARRTAIESDIRASMRRRAPMRPVKGS